MKCLKNRTFLLLVLLLSLLLCSGLAGCGRRKPHAAKPAPVLQEEYSGGIAEGKELLCLADSREEAEEIAESYGIELVSFESGVAVFHTQENPRDVIARGKSEGLPELSLNRIVKAFD